MNKLQEALEECLEENVLTSALVQQHWLHCAEHMAYAKQGQAMKLGA